MYIVSEVILLYNEICKINMFFSLLNIEYKGNMVYIMSTFKIKFFNKVTNRFSSIRSRLLIYFILLVILPVSAISLTLYEKSSRIITEKFNTTIIRSFNMMEGNITQKFNSVYNTITSICLDQNIIEVLSRNTLVNADFKIDEAQILREMTNMNKVLETYASRGLSGNLIYPRIYIYNRPEYQLNRFTSNVFDLDQISNEKWYPQLNTQDRYSVIGVTKTITPSGFINSILIAKRLFGLKNRDFSFAGVLTVEVPIKEFNYILENYKPSKNSNAFIVDSAGTIILSKKSDDIGKDLSKIEYLKTIFLKENISNYGIFNSNIKSIDTKVAYKKLLPYNWTIISFSPLSDLDGELKNFNSLVYTVVFICLIIAILTSFVVSDSISYPIKKLVKSMVSIRKGDFNSKLEYKRNDEFSILITTFQEMVSEINNLIQKLYVTELDKKEAELKALQAQINPHFLYNTLDSVNWMAMRNNVPEISTMVRSLSNFFRFSLSKGENIISMRDEKAQIEAYLTIQQIRFKDKLFYTLDFPNYLLDFLTVKLILQPVVENSIIHGIEQLPGEGHISIIAKKMDDIIEIHVIDNGIGADVNDLNIMLDDLNSPMKSYGVRNVNKRIKLYFGTMFGLEYKNNEDQGITAIIKIPAVRTMEGYHASNDNS